VQRAVFFGALSQIGINILGIAQGGASRSISCVIPHEDTHTAVRTVHAAFNFSHHEVSLIICGEGSVASCLVKQIITQQHKLHKKHRVVIKIMAIGTDAPKGYLFQSNGLELQTCVNFFTSKPRYRTTTISSHHK